MFRVLRFHQVNPLARGKVYVERVLADMQESGTEVWGMTVLRFGIVSGAHPSGRLGQDATKSQVLNLIKEASLVVMGKRPSVVLAKNSGQMVRDYVHVVDVADAFVAATKKLVEPAAGRSRSKGKAVGSFEVYNIGTGEGVSDQAAVDAVAAASGLKVVQEVSGKKGKNETSKCVLNVEKAAAELGWVPQRDLMAMCKDFWRWQNANPTGFVRPKKEFGAFQPATFQKSAMPELSSSGRRRSTDDVAFSKPVSNWEPRRADGTKKFDKAIRGWEKDKRVTKPTFAGKLDGLDSIDSLDDAEYVEAMGQAF